MNRPPSPRSIGAVIGLLAGALLVLVGWRILMILIGFALAGYLVGFSFESRRKVMNRIKDAFTRLFSD